MESEKERGREGGGNKRGNKGKREDSVEEEIPRKRYSNIHNYAHRVEVRDKALSLINVALYFQCSARAIYDCA